MRMCVCSSVYEKVKKKEKKGKKLSGAYITMDKRRKREGGWFDCCGRIRVSQKSS